MARAPRDLIAGTRLVTACYSWESPRLHGDSNQKEKQPNSASNTRSEEYKICSLVSFASKKHRNCSNVESDFCQDCDVIEFSLSVSFTFQILTTRPA